MRAAASNASCAATWRTTAIDTPDARYVHTTTVVPSRRAARRRSMRAQRAYMPRAAAAAPQTTTYQRRGDAACVESSSSGSASATRGPGSDGRTRYNQPLAANATASASGTEAALRSMQPPRGGEQRIGGVSAPQRPVVAAADDAVAVTDVDVREERRELRVLLLEVVAGAAVEPDVRVRVAQLRGGGVERQQRAVVREGRGVVTEDRAEWVGTFVAGPALEHLELAGVVDADVDRAVPALRQAGQPPRPTGPNCAVAPVDRPDEVACHEGLPTLVRSDAVRPLLVGERARRSERHHEDDRLDLVQRHELVLDHAHPHRRKERARTAGDAVQEVQHGIAAVRMQVVAGRQVDVDRLTTAAERGAGDVQADLGPPLVDVRGVARGCEAAIEPVVVDVAVGAHEPDDDEHGDDHRERPAAAKGRCLPSHHSVRCTSRSLKRRLSVD